MSEIISNFINNFQDMIVTKKTTIDQFPTNITHMELSLLDLQLTDIKNKIKAMSDLTDVAVKTGNLNYDRTIEILENKINYISDTADILLYINSFYDSNTIRFLNNYDLKSYANNSIVYDTTQGGLTLRSISNTYRCPKSSITASTQIFYNTNSSYHSGISLETDYLEFLDIKSIIIQKADGTILNLTVDLLNKNIQYIPHDLLTSTQIIVEFGVNPALLNPEQQIYYNSLNISLIDYEYQSEGTLVIPEVVYDSADIFNIISRQSIPADCFINLNLDVILLDINMNKISTEKITIPIGNPIVCKRLDNLDKNEVESISGIYINKLYRDNTNKDILIEDLLAMANKNEVYVIYKNKMSSNQIANNFIKPLGYIGFYLLSNYDRYIKLSLNIEMFSFNNKSTPLLKTLTGITKDETI